MISDYPLTAEQRLLSQRNFNHFFFLNGASYMCLGDTVVTLFANKLGASNAVIAILGSMVFLGYLMLPLGILRTRRVGGARSMSDFWMCRNVMAMMFVVSAVVHTSFSRLSIVILLTCSFLFYGFRAAGYVMSQPLIGNITTDEDRTAMVSGSNARFYIAEVLMLCIISGILHWNDSLQVLSCIIITGGLLGVTAAVVFLRKMWETRTICDSARNFRLNRIGDAWENRNLRRLVVAGIGMNLLCGMLSTVTVAVAKRGYDVSDFYVLIMTAFEFLAASVGSQLSTRLIKRMGLKGFSLFTVSVVFPLCLFWCVIPSEWTSWWKIVFFAIPFILLGAYTSWYNNAVTCYFLRLIEPENQVTSTICLNVMMGVGAGLLGMFLSSSVMKGCEMLAGHHVIMAFKFYFAACFVCGVGVLALTQRLRRL